MATACGLQHAHRIACSPEDLNYTEMQAVDQGSPRQHHKTDYDCQLEQCDKQHVRRALDELILWLNAKGLKQQTRQLVDRISDYQRHAKGHPSKDSDNHRQINVGTQIVEPLVFQLQRWVGCAH